MLLLQPYFKYLKYRKVHNMLLNENKNSRTTMRFKLLYLYSKFPQCANWYTWNRSAMIRWYNCTNLGPAHTSHSLKIKQHSYNSDINYSYSQKLKHLPFPNLFHNLPWLISFSIFFCLLLIFRQREPPLTCRFGTKDNTLKTLTTINASNSRKSVK